MVGSLVERWRPTIDLDQANLDDVEFPIHCEIFVQFQIKKPSLETFAVELDAGVGWKTKRNWEWTDSVDCW